MTAARKADPSARRRAQLAAIHILRKELGMDHETYVAVLRRIADADTSATLDAGARSRVLDELRRLRGDSVRRTRNAVPAAHAPRAMREETAAMIGKVGAILADAGRDWNYAHGLARRMFRVQRAEWLTPEQLHRLIAALAIDQKRRRNRAVTTSNGDQT